MPHFRAFARLCPALLSLAALACNARATSYYVSNTMSTASDSYATSSATAPWKTIGHLNTAATLVAGDKVFLYAGDTFTDAGLKVGPGEANAANQVVIDRFGTATTNPTIKPPAGQHAIDIYDVGGVTVKNLILKGPGVLVADPTPSFGVSLWSDLTSGNKCVATNFDSLTISDFYHGISIGTPDTTFVGFKDVTISNCTIHDCVSEGIYSYGKKTGASMTQQTHQNIQVSNTTVYSCKGDPTLAAGVEHSGSGIILSSVLTGKVLLCTVHDCGGDANANNGGDTGGGPVGIWCYSADSVTIESCLVYNQKTSGTATDGGGFDIDGASTRCIIQYCYSYNNDGPGYEVVEYAGTGVPNLNDATVRYNISYKDGRIRSQGSLSIYNGQSAATACNNVKFYNNIVISQDVSSTVLNPCVDYPQYSGPVNAKFYNNIFYALGTSKLVNITYNTSSFTFKGNCYYSVAGTPKWTWGATTYTTLAGWQAATGTPEKNGSTSVGYYGNPAFPASQPDIAQTSAGSLTSMVSFIPTSTTVVINKGQNLTTSTYGSLNVGTRDFKNKPNFVGGAYDIGAYEKQ